MAVVNAGWSGPPSEFFEFDGALLHAAPNPASAAGEPTFNARLLLLPTGQVLYSNCTHTIEIYTPSGGPNPAWRPEITKVDRDLHPGETYRLHGRQLNGLSQAVAYGDDAQMATNYPLVRLQGAPGVGFVFCRTFNHSTMAVATGNAVHHTNFMVPAHLAHGEYELVVIANGIASDAIKVHLGPKHQDRDDDHDQERHHRHDRDDDDGGSLSLHLNLPLSAVRRRHH